MDVFKDKVITLIKNKISEEMKSAEERLNKCKSNMTLWDLEIYSTQEHYHSIRADILKELLKEVENVD